jgi:hypothetical protein
MTPESYAKPKKPLLIRTYKGLHSDMPKPMACAATKIVIAKCLPSYMGSLTNHIAYAATKIILAKERHLALPLPETSTPLTPSLRP